MGWVARHNFFGTGVLPEIVQDYGHRNSDPVAQISPAHISGLLLRNSCHSITTPVYSTSCAVHGSGGTDYSRQTRLQSSIHLAASAASGRTAASAHRISGENSSPANLLVAEASRARSPDSGVKAPGRGGDCSQATAHPEVGRPALRPD